MKLVIAVGLVTIALAMSGCCSCCSSLSNSTDSGTKTPADIAPSDPGDADNLYGHWMAGQSTMSSSAYSDMGIAIDFYKNGTFTYTGVFHKFGGGGQSYNIMGRYHASGDSIKYTHIVKYYYQDLDQPDHTTTDIADTSGTYRIEPGDTCDTIYLQADGLWDNETELYRYPS